MFWSHFSKRIQPCRQVIPSRISSGRLAVWRSIINRQPFSRRLRHLHHNSRIRRHRFRLAWHLTSCPFRLLSTETSVHRISTGIRLAFSRNWARDNSEPFISPNWIRRLPVWSDRRPVSNSITDANAFSSGWSAHPIPMLPIGSEKSEDCRLCETRPSPKSSLWQRIYPMTVETRSRSG